MNKEQEDILLTCLELGKDNLIFQYSCNEVSYDSYTYYYDYKIKLQCNEFIQELYNFSASNNIPIEEFLRCISIHLLPEYEHHTIRGFEVETDYLNYKCYLIAARVWHNIIVKSPDSYKKDRFTLYQHLLK